MGNGLVFANDYPGADIGAKINAADSDLGSKRGVIVVYPGDYTISTQIVLNDGHRLLLGDGTYDNTMTTTCVFLMKNDTEVSSLNRWGARVKETVNRDGGGATSVVQDYLSSLDDTVAGNDNLTVRGIAFIAKATVADGLSATVQFGNASNILVEDCYFNSTKGFCVCAGGNSTVGGHCAQNVRYLNNTCIEAGTQNLCIVNGINVLIDGNLMVAGGAGGIDKSTFIDLELNSPTDRLENVIVSNNTIDARGGIIGNASKGIQVVGGRTLADSPPTKNANGIFITNNTILGGATDHGDGSVISSGIVVALAESATISGNYIRFCGQQGIYLVACDNSKISGNMVIDCGPVNDAVQQTISLVGSRWTTVSDNQLSTQLGSSYYVGITEQSDEFYGQTCDFTRVYGNRLYFSPSQSPTGPTFEPRITLTGANSREWNNDIGGQTWGAIGVDTLTALTSGYVPGARASGLPPLASVLGITAPGDTQPASFYYDPESTATVNGYTVLKPANATNGRWVRPPSAPKLDSTAITTLASGLTSSDFGFEVLNTSTNKRQCWDGSQFQDLW